MSNQHKAKDKENVLPEAEPLFSVEELSKWRFSEDTLVSTLTVHIEREKTRQQQLRAQILDKQLELLRAANEYQIPKDRIPLIFQNVPKIEDILQLRRSEEAEKSPNRSPARTHSSASSLSQPSTSVFRLAVPQKTQFQFHHWAPGPLPDRPLQHRRGFSENIGRVTKGHLRSGLEGGVSGTFASAGARVSSAGSSSGSSSGRRGHKRGQSKTDVDFMISHPEE